MQQYAAISVACESSQTSRGCESYEAVPSAVQRVRVLLASSRLFPHLVVEIRAAWSRPHRAGRASPAKPGPLAARHVSAWLLRLSAQGFRRPEPLALGCSGCRLKASDLQSHQRVRERWKLGTHSTRVLEAREIFQCER